MTTFNPIKEDKDGVRARRTIWSSEAIRLAIKGLEEGRRLYANPFYENNVKLLKADLTYQRTPEEVEEWKRCRDDIMYFANHYCQVATPEGLQVIHLRDYQEEYLKHLEKHRLSICCACRQCGKSITTAIFLVHYICFHLDKLVLYTANKLKTAKEVIEKSRSIFYGLPYFIKPGIRKWNETEISLDNGCRVLAESTTPKTGIGLSINMLVIDEGAHIPSNVIEPFYANVMPTIVANSTSHLVIISTQNGHNLFYRLYKAAEEGKSDLVPFKIDWWQVPEWDADGKCWVKRDEAWKQKQIALYGSEEAFNSQFGTDFELGTKTLVTRQKIREVEVKKFIILDMPGVQFHDRWCWQEGLDLTGLKYKHAIITCDLAEQLGQDYTVFSVWIQDGDAITRVGYFRDNRLEREHCVDTLMSFINIYCNQNNTLLSWERNTYGDLFFATIKDHEDAHPGFDRGIIVSYTQPGRARDVLSPGVKITPSSKAIHCNLFKDDYEKGRIVADDDNFMFELGNFIVQDNGSCAASYGHDDSIMTAIQLEYLKETNKYKYFKESMGINQPTPQGNIYDWIGGDFIKKEGVFNRYADTIGIRKGINDR